MVVSSCKPWSIRSYSEFRKTLAAKGQVPPQVRTFLEEWLPKLEADPFTAGSFKQWGKSGPGIFSAHLPLEWRLLFTVDQEKRLVILHTLQDHENYDSDRIRRRIQDRMKRGHHSPTSSVSTASASQPKENLQEALAPLEPEHWITQSDLQELEIPQRFWETILRFASRPGTPDFNASGLPEHVVDALEAWYTSAEAELDKIYEVRLISGHGPGAASLVTLRLVLDPSQREAEFRLLQSKGPYIVKGGPGTGKSVVLLHAAIERARQESQRPIPDEDPKPTGLMTFNTGIRDRHLEDAAALAPDMTVALRASEVNAETPLVITNLDRWITRPVMVDHLGFKAAPLNEWNELGALRKALSEVKESQPRLGQILDQLVDRVGAEYILKEFTTVILGNGFSVKEGYLEAGRKGRKAPLKEPEREAIWALACRHGARLTQKKLWTFPSARSKVLRAIQEDAGLARKYAFDLLFVDEAQDLHPVMLKMLLVLVGGDPKRLRLASDPGQCLYGQAIVWNRVDQRLSFQGRSSILKESHRTGRALAEAVHRLRVSKEDGLEAIPLPSAHRQGERPRLVFCPQDQHLDWLDRWWADWNRRGHPVRDVALLCRDKATLEAVSARLNLDTRDPDTPVRLLKKIRGPEWPVVIIPFLTRSHFPPAQERARLHTDALPEAMEDERSLLYVGLTRASHRAILLADPEDRSELLDYLELSKWRVDEGEA